MNLILSDQPLHFLTSLPSDTVVYDLSQQTIHPCVGCFGCWTKTPGKCVIRDDAPNIYPKIAASERILYISHIWCGSFDTPMKTLMERSIPVQQAFIRIHQGETHHVQRAVVPKEAIILAYGADTQEEQTLFKRLVERNAKNMSFSSWKIHFRSPDTLQEAILEEVSQWNHS